MKKSIVIVGAGLGGLATACRLARLGYRVTVVEQNNQVGGKASELRIDEFRFDRGPSFMTMIEVFVDLFNFCGEKIADYISYKPLDVTVRYHWPDKTSFTSFQDLDKTVSLLCQELGEDESKVQSYFSKVKQIYEISKPFALDKPIDFRSVFDPEFAKASLKFLSLGVVGSLQGLHRQVFSNPKTCSIFDRWAAYIYSDPSRLPAIMSSVGWAEVGLGLYLPLDGINGISKGIGDLAVKLGVRIILNTQVVNLEQNTDNSWNVTTLANANGRMDFLTADILISNLDIKTFHKNLLQKTLSSDAGRIKKSGGSYLIFYWGVKHHQKLESLGLHNIFFGEGYETGIEFKQQFREDNVADNPMVYLNITSKIIPEDAPIIDGQKSQNWITIISTPPENGKIHWKQEITTKRDYILELISNQLNIKKLDLTSLIVCEKVMTPLDIEDWTGSYNGDLAGCRIESIKDVLSRPKVKSSQYENLFFVGGSINPGPGMPMVLLCAKHCAEAVESTRL